MNTLLRRASLVPGALLAALSGGVASAQAPLYDLSGPAGSQYGHALESVGDVDGDGFDDLAVGAPYADGLQPGAGRVYVHSARTHQVLVVMAVELLQPKGFGRIRLRHMDNDSAEQVVAFVHRHRPRMSGLTLREATRNLPPEMKKLLV